MRHKNWECPKCSCKDFETGEMRASGGFWAKIFDIQNKRYFSASCENCGYTEFYRGDTSMAGNVFDFFTN